MQVDRLELGMIGTNCYIAANEETKQAIVIDPADQADKIGQFMDSRALTACAILLTHGHFDHIYAARDLAGRYGISVYAHQQEKQVLGDIKYNMSGDFGHNFTMDADKYLQDQEELTLAGLHLQVLFTPGHTSGGCCYYFPEEKVLFSGDSLFKGSIGRTDFPSGDTLTLLHSIKDKLMVLDDQVVVYPGHQGSTTIGQERKENPFIR